MLFLFALSSDPGQNSTFVLTAVASAQKTELPDLVLPTQATIFVLTFIVAFFGGWQLARGFRAVNALLAVIIFIFIFAFLTWADRGRQFNLTGMLIASLVRSTPIALGALSGILCERAGVVNIAIEGMMLAGAFSSVVVGSATDNLYLGIIFGILTGGAMAAIHAVLSIRFRVDQIVSGVVINILAAGLTSYLTERFLSVHQELNDSGALRPISIPFLVDIPVLGPVLFENTLIVYSMLFLLVAVHILLFYTRWGLRTRAVGEHPRAADTLGINVFKMRYINVILGGMVAGLGGAYFTVGSVGRFDELLTGGRGYIGLAAMIFGKWSPFGAFASSLIFGFADSLQQKLAILQAPIPSQFLGMAPYIATIVILAGVVGRAIPPAADGQPYEKQ
ncbi:MAG: ABC transporter permease [Chloroflexi bacterium]|nr:ABC transporter permease [Chloroflexota bacterium]